MSNTNKKSTETTVNSKSDTKRKVGTNGANGTKLNKKGITEENLQEAIINTHGSISDIAKVFGYRKESRSTIYRLIAKFNLNECLKTARGYEDRLSELIGDLAIEKTLDSLEAIIPKDINKQQVVLLIFVLKSLAGFVEAKTKISLDEDDSSINSLIEALNRSTARIQKEKEQEV